MKRVLKWDVPVDDKDHPIGTGKVVMVHCQWSPATVQVWTEEDDDPKVESPKVRRARVYGTGHQIPDRDVHIGSAVSNNTALVWHVYGSPV